MNLQVRWRMIQGLPLARAREGDSGVSLEQHLTEATTEDWLPTWILFVCS